MLFNNTLTLNSEDPFLFLNAELIDRIKIFAAISEGFTLSVVEVNRKQDCQTLIQSLITDSTLPRIQWVVVHLDDPTTTNIMAELKNALRASEQSNVRKKVVIVYGLENAIGRYGDYPEVLAKVNFDRDSFPQQIPHPILFLLPSYALNRWARFAPDFWAWKSAEFRLESTYPKFDPADIKPFSLHDIPWTEPVPPERIDFLTYYLDRYSPSDPMRGALFEQLGNAYDSLREHQNAEQAYGEALKIYRQLERFLDVADIFDRLAAMARRYGQFPQAADFCQKALDIREHHLGSDHPITAGSYSHLGTVLQDLGDYEGAKALLHKAIEINEHHFGSEHPITVGSYSNMAMVLKDLGDYEGAKALLHKALAINAHHVESDYSTTAALYSNLGIIMQALGDYEGAKTLLDKALALDDHHFGPDHPATVVSYSNLAMVLKDLGDCEEAKALLSKALALDKQHFGPDHPTTAVSYSNLALVLIDLGDYAGAVPLLESAFHIFTTTLGSDHPNTTTVLGNYLAALQTMIASDPATLEPLLNQGSQMTQQHLQQMLRKRREGS